MEQNNLFEKIKQTSENGTFNPSNDVWNRLEKRLDTETQISEPPSRLKKIFSIRRLSIAASLLFAIGAYTVLHQLGNPADSSTAIQLENLHTLEVNPRFNIQMAGESSTIPSVRAIRAIPAVYKSVIKEGTSEKKLIIKKPTNNEQKEYGLG